MFRSFSLSADQSSRAESIVEQNTLKGRVTRVRASDLSMCWPEHLEVGLGGDSESAAEDVFPHVRDNTGDGSAPAAEDASADGEYGDSEAAVEDEPPDLEANLVSNDRRNLWRVRVRTFSSTRMKLFMTPRYYGLYRVR